MILSGILRGRADGEVEALVCQANLQLLPPCPITARRVGEGCVPASLVATVHRWITAPSNIRERVPLLQLGPVDCSHASDASACSPHAGTDHELLRTVRA